MVASVHVRCLVAVRAVGEDQGERIFPNGADLRAVDGIQVQVTWGNFVLFVRGAVLVRVRHFCVANSRIVNREAKVVFN